MKTIPLSRQVFRVSLLGLSCFSVSALAGLALELNPREIAQTARRITVQIHAGDLSRTGTVVSQRGSTVSVLTCNDSLDAVREESRLETYVGQEYRISSSRVFELENLDLVLIQFTTNRSYPHAILADSTDLQQGEPIYVGGFSELNYDDRPVESEFIFSSGVISSLIQPSQPQGYGMTHTSQTSETMSGSPILNAQGYVLAVHCEQNRRSRRSNAETPWNLAIPIHRFTQVSRRMGLNLDLATANSTETTPNHHPSRGDPEPDSDGRLW